MQPFRGQFIAANFLSKIPSNFIRTEIEGLLIYHHRDLPIAVDGQAALVGLVFDPTNPPFGIGDILADIRRRCSSGRTDHLAGRWALIDGNIVLHDACGTMPLAYVTRGGQTIVASSSALLAYCLEDLKRDVRFDNGAWNVKRREAHSGLAFPATFTEYIGVRALLPNHYLDRNTGKAVRYYPATRPPLRRAEELAPQIAGMLSRVVRAVCLRGPCAMGITAGYDSRALAAALSTIDGMSERTTFFTFQDQFACPAGHCDIVTGRKIAETVGGSHALIVADAAPTTVVADTMLAPRFEAWVKASAELEGRTVLTGWCSEVGRAFIRWHGSDDPTAEQIADCHAARSLAFALPEFEQWLSDARHIRAEHGIPIMDLFYWEYRCHRWIGSGLNILNTGADWISVYSCRDLLSLILSVKESERGGKTQELYRKIILCLKPELLDVPFNPEPLHTRIARSVKSSARALTVRLTQKFGIYETLKRARRAIP